MSSRSNAELAATCSSLGRLHKGKYLIEPECIESIKDLIRYLKRDNESHDIRRYLGEAKILQNDLIHIIKSCSEEETDLFDVTLRLLINLTTPTILLYGEELPVEKVGRNIYLSLIDHNLDYKVAFSDIDFWNKICGKLTNLFETDWAERSADDSIQIERILMLLRNVLQVPADFENEKILENIITIHDKVLWALRQSQILELLLFVSSSDNEQYYLNLLEIFSLILREQNPKWLAHTHSQISDAEKTKDSEELVKARQTEKQSCNKYLNTRNFNATYVMKGVKSLSNHDVVCHKALDKAVDISRISFSKKQIKTKKNKIPVESERVERHATFSVRLFLKEFSLEFLNTGFNHLMSVVKNRLDSGKSLANDQSYYFWALHFFLDFAVASNLDVDLVKNCLSTETFHFVQTSMDNASEHLMSEKKKTAEWVKRTHLILKAYYSLLEALLWLDCSKNPMVRAISREIKSEIFYVVEYREMTLHVLFRYDSSKFSVAYLRDLIETIHLFVKLLEDFSKQVKLVVQKVERKKSKKKKNNKQEEIVPETNEEKWEKIKDDVYDTLCSETLFPEIPPFDAASDIPIDDQKGRAMIKIQKFLHEGNIREGIGMLRSARQVWPENDCFGSAEMSVEEETMALQEICQTDLREVEGYNEEYSKSQPVEEENNEVEEEEEEENEPKIVEKDFDIMEYKKRLVHKKVVECCCILLKNYYKNTDHTNHCAIKLLHRIGWECCMPAMLYQASLFWTLLTIMKDKRKKYKEINTFTLNLMRKFRKHSSSNPVVFLELLFWKEHNVALEIQHGYEPYKDKDKEKPKKKRGRKSKKGEENLENEGEEGVEGLDLDGKPKTSGRKPRRSKKQKEKDNNEILSLSEKHNDNETQENFQELENANSESSEDEFEKLKRMVRVSNDEPEVVSSEKNTKKNEKLSRKKVSKKIDMSEMVLNESDQEKDVSKSAGDKNELSDGELSQWSVESDKENYLNEVQDFEKSLGLTKKRSDDESSSESEIAQEKKSKEKEDDLESDDKISKKVLSSRNRLLYSSDEEESPLNESKRDSYQPARQIEDISDRSQDSETSSKKRVRKNNVLSEDSDDSSGSKVKRLRYVSSDSEAEEFELGNDVRSGEKRKQRKRLAVIDSESDGEADPLADK